MATETEELGTSITVRNYTAAMTYPSVIGKFAGVTLPVTLTLTQIVVGLGMAVALGVTRTVWMLVVPDGFLTLSFFCGAVGGPMWAVRRGSLEGRPVLVAAASWLEYLLLPRTVDENGQPVADDPSVRMHAKFKAVSVQESPVAGRPESSAGDWSVRHYEASSQEVARHSHTPPQEACERPATSRLRPRPSTGEIPTASAWAAMDWDDELVGCA